MTRFLFVRDFCQVSYRMRDELRARGHMADVIAFIEQPGERFGDVPSVAPGASWGAARISEGSLRPDWYMPDAAWRGRHRISKWRRLIHLAKGYDVVCWHGGLPWWARFVRGVRHVAHYHGSELTSGKRLHQRPGMAQFVSTPNLQEFAPEAHWIPNPGPAFDPPTGRRNVIGHYPSNPRTKGTAEIQAALDQVMPDHPGFEVDVSMGVEHGELMDRLDRCAVLIDQHNGLGAYGVLAIEAMAKGCVVLSSIRPEWYPDCPIISTRDGLEEALRRTFSQQANWPAWGKAGRNFAKSNHSAAGAVDQLLAALAD